jgi:enoyl-CoA hydratase/carnithine racemase
MDQLMARCAAIAAEICQSAPLAVQRIKHVALRGLDRSLTEGLELEREHYAWLQTTEDAREGALAFAEKRSPNWKAR